MANKPGVNMNKGNQKGGASNQPGQGRQSRAQAAGQPQGNPAGQGGRQGGQQGNTPQGGKRGRTSDAQDEE